VTYQVQVLPGVRAALDRLQETDHAGAALIVSTFDELAADPRPAASHVLNETERLYLAQLSRLDPVTRRTLRYRITYQIHDGDLVVVVVVVIAAGALPRPSRRH
jgi:mRNA-degrading endonuclease RelE of RelBE toxin-antitoxin system